MRKLLTPSLLALTLAAAATPALAKSRGFDSTLTTSLTTPVKIEIVLSEDMAHRANNLPEKLSDRSHATFRDGFIGNGFYGDRDLEYLQENLRKDLEKNFAKKGIETSQTAATVLRVTIEDAKPNRPTQKQLSKLPGLSFRSISVGGAELGAELISAQGSSLGSITYDYYETDIRDAAFGGTWSDANFAFERFALRAAKELQN